MDFSYIDPAILAKIPIVQPPPGVSSNFINPETRAPVILAFIGICLALTWPVYLLRVYSKTFIARKFTWDDVTCPIAIIGVTVFASFSCWEMTILGPRGWNVPVSKITPQFSKVSVIVTIMVSSIVAFFTKTSLLLLYLHVFSPKVWFRRTVYASILLCALVYGGCTITAGVLCVARPGESWLTVQISDRCSRGFRSPTILLGVFSFVSDVFLFVLPIPVIWQLHLTTKKKIGLSAIFATGLFAIVASILGLYYRVVDAYTTDHIWDLPPVLLTVTVEFSVGILCACMPYLAPLFRKKQDDSSRKPFSSIRSLLARFSRSTHRSSNSKANRFPLAQQYKNMPGSKESTSCEVDYYPGGRTPQVTAVSRI